MSDSDTRLARMERRQEHLIKAIGDLATICATTNGMVMELIKWMQKEPEGPRLVDIVLEVVRMMVEVQGTLARIAKAVHAEDA